MGVIVTLLTLFLVGTAVYAIVSSLENLSNLKSDSEISTKLFKWKAPVGLAYGIVVVFLVIAEVVYFKQQGVFDTAQEKVNPKTDQSAWRVTMDLSHPSSIFGGKVLIIPKKVSPSQPAILQFVGTTGISFDLNGEFLFNSVAIYSGQKFFIKNPDLTIWGVNVLSLSPLTLEIYKE
jgi:hypothetical protein